MKFAAMCGAAVMTLAAGVSIAVYPLPVRLVVFAGGPADSVAHPRAKTHRRARAELVVDNRAGATGTIGAGIVATSPPDGYTLLLGTSNELAMSPGLFEKLPWDVTSDLVPAALIAQTPFIIVVSPQANLKNLRALIAEARARPGKLNFGSAGVGSVNHVVTALFLHKAGIDATHIPYKGMSEASVGLQGGQVDMMIAPAVGRPS